MENNITLHLAVTGRKWVLARDLIQQGASVNLCHSRMGTPLQAAIASKGAPMGVVQQLISPQNINMWDMKCRTSLHLALLHRRWDLVPLLITSGADVNWYDDEWNRPLHVAVKITAVSVDVVTQLISAKNINSKNRHNDTALHIAVCVQNWNLVPLLLQHGTDVNSCDYTRSRPLHVAVKLKMWDLVPVLLQHGADRNMCDRDNNTPLHVALNQSDVPMDVVTQLISPCNINNRGEGGFTALHEAVKWKLWDLVPVLLQHGADVNICDDHNNSALYEAVLNVGVPVNVCTQLVSTQNVNGKDALGGLIYSLLWHASLLYKLIWQDKFCTESEVAAVLLQHGGRIYIHKNKCFTAIEQVLRQKCTPAVYTIARNLMYRIKVQYHSKLDVVLRKMVKEAVKGGIWSAIPELIECGSRERDALIQLVYKLAEPSQLQKAKLRLFTSTTKLLTYRFVGNYTLTELVVRKGACCLLPWLLGLGAHVKLEMHNVAKLIMHEYNAETVRVMLQHLSMPYHLTHVEFIFIQNRMEKLEINNTNIELPRNSPIELLSLVDISCHLLQQTCLVKDQSYTRLEDIHTNVDASIVSYVTRKHAEFEVISGNPETLHKLCVVTIRQHLPHKTDENFTRLGLPPGLLSKVTLRSLAEELDLMWQQGKLQ